MCNYIFLRVAPTVSGVIFHFSCPCQSLNAYSPTTLCHVTAKACLHVCLSVTFSIYPSRCLHPQRHPWWSERRGGRRITPGWLVGCRLEKDVQPARFTGTDWLGSNVMTFELNYLNPLADCTTRRYHQEMGGKTVCNHRSDELSPLHPLDGWMQAGERAEDRMEWTETANWNFIAAVQLFDWFWKFQVDGGSSIQPVTVHQNWTDFALDRIEQ